LCLGEFNGWLFGVELIADGSAMLGRDTGHTAQSGSFGHMDIVKYLTYCPDIGGYVNTFDYADQANFVGPGSAPPTRVCLENNSTPGALAVTLNLGPLFQSLGFAADASIAFQGTIVDDHHVRWDIDQPLNVDVQGWLPGLHLDHVTGSLTTLLTKIDPPVSYSGCNAPWLSYEHRLKLTTDGTENHLRLAVNYDNFADQVDLTNVQLDASAGQLYPEVSIGVRKNSQCDPIWIEGEIVELSAVVTNPPQGLDTGYTWQVSPAATALTPLDQQTIQVRLASPPQQLVVSATLIVEGVPWAGKYGMFSVLPKGEAAILEKLCEIARSMDRFRRPLYINPGDPWPFARSRPISDEELRPLRSLAREMIETGRSLNELLDSRAT
jgi:hypothetical protein